MAEVVGCYYDCENCSGRGGCLAWETGYDDQQERGMGYQWWRRPEGGGTTMVVGMVVVGDD